MALSNLAPGSRLGPYEVTALVGEGGMGQVYRATDTKLDRDVAIKVLPEAFAHDAERLARFTREAKTLAALNHPNIAAIYGLEEARSGGSSDPPITALVMELVEGEDLSQRIARGAIPIDEALPLAKQIAEALEAAHEQGIIHRDLKPANIKVRSDGTVKVLDFGLAKAMDPPAGSSPQVSQSPTITTPAMTQAGMILGTAAYMSPEQAKGKTVDKRADIWAFGVVLHEMLTGQRLFNAETIPETLAHVMTREIDLGSLPATTPRHIRTLLARCLVKEPKQRLRDIGEARLALAGAFETAVSEAPGPTPSAVAPRSMVARALPWALAGAFAVAAGVLLMLWAPWRPAPVPAPRKLMALLGADASLPTVGGASAILSPDGTTLAFVAQQAGQTRLFVRKLDQLQASALADTERARDPFFSPDGQWIAFFNGGALKKISVTGGAAVTLCDAANSRGGTWAGDDTILFNPSGSPNMPLHRVSAAGGTPTVFGTLSEGATTHRWPQALPGGQAVLFTEHSETGNTGNWNAANIVVAPLSGGTPKVIVRGGHYGRYVPGGPGSSQREGGHLIYLQQGTLFAVRFDLTRLETVGPAVPALEGVAGSTTSGGAQVAVSSEGTLVYVPGTIATAARPIDWLTRDGTTAVLRAAEADWANPQFSPDGQKLAVDISDGKQRDVWVYEWATDRLTQLTFDPGQDQYPLWTPDGRRIAFASDRASAGTTNLYAVNADGSGEVTRLTDSPGDQRPSSWHPSGRFLAFQAERGATGTDLMILPIEGDATRAWAPGTPTVFLSTPAGESHPTFSPDGRWIAYSSTEVSTGDVFVRPFPGPGGPWRISPTGGGRFARWSVTTPELLFMSGGQLVAARYAVVGDSFRADRPQVWSPANIQGASPANFPYDLHPDGKRVATSVTREQASSLQDKVVFVTNFADYLRTIAPGGR